METALNTHIEGRLKSSLNGAALPKAQPNIEQHTAVVGKTIELAGKAFPLVQVESVTVKEVPVEKHVLVHVPDRTAMLTGACMGISIGVIIGILLHANVL